MVAASKSLGKPQLRYLEALQLFLGILLNRKEERMSERKFYPMLTQTIKSALCLADSSNVHLYVNLLILYPEKPTHNNPNDPISSIILNELDRQYARWDKKGATNEI